MTGLDLERDALIEIACLVTDAELNLLDDGIDVIIKPPAEALDQMPRRRARDAHGVRAARRPAERRHAGRGAEAVLDYVRKHVPEPRKVPLCGNSIATDRWLHRPRHARAGRLPALPDGRRVVDQGAGPPVVPAGLLRQPAKHGGHRALADINESVQELRYYREALFVPQPGPDSATAQGRSPRGTGTRRRRSKTCRSRRR